MSESEKRNARFAAVTVNTFGDALAASLDAVVAMGKRTAFRQKDAARKRRERAMNKALGRRSDGHVIRPLALA